MSLIEKNRKPYFLTQKPPPGYIPGVGRGATGFITRSDYGGIEDNEELCLPKSRGARDDLEVESEGLFSGGMYDANDAEADRTWTKIDHEMDNRRRRQRETRESLETAQYLVKKPKVQSLFAEEKKALADVSIEEWSAIPDIGDRGLKFKRNKNQIKYTPAPDSLLVKTRQDTQSNAYLSVKDLTGLPVGFESVDGSASILAAANTPLSSTRSLGLARKTMLDSRLQEASRSVSTGIFSVVGSTESTLDSSAGTTGGDYSKVRKILSLAVRSEIGNPASWIALARHDEAAGKLLRARKVIKRACESCMKSKDVWLEAVRLLEPEEARQRLKGALEVLDTEIDLWLAAVNLEPNREKKRRLYHEALEHNPTSITLWKEAVDLEDKENAKIMLRRAVECVPQSTQMWLALAKLENYQEARKILNEARRFLPKEHLIWIAAAQLEEAQKHEENVGKIISRALESLAVHNVNLSREEWLREAQRCEESGSVVTCSRIIEQTIGMGLDNDCKSIWMEDAAKAVASGYLVASRAIYRHAAQTLGKRSIWRHWAQMEKKHGDSASTMSVLKEAVRSCPNDDTMWLMIAKEYFEAGNYEDARRIIQEASIHVPNSENVWIAASKVEQREKNFERARDLLSIARQKTDSPRVWMKSALLERILKCREAERQLLDEALVRHRNFDKLWMMSGQWYEPVDREHFANKQNQIGAKSKFHSAASVEYSKGLTHCFQSVPLWLCAIRHAEATFGANHARALCDRARLTVTDSPEIYLESIRIEVRSGQMNAAHVLCAKAVQRLPKSSILRIAQIDLESQASKKTKFTDALMICDTSALLLATGAKLFIEARKYTSAKEWFARAIKVDSSIGDVWIEYYKFVLQHYPEEVSDLLKRCSGSSPRYGEQWTRISKDPDNWFLSTEEILQKAALENTSSTQRSSPMTTL